MSEAERLAREITGNGQPAAQDLPAWLTSALGLDAVGRTVIAANVFGRGPTARVDLLLSGDEKLIFERFGDIAKPQQLAANLVTQLGVVKTFKGTEASQAAAAVFRLAQHHRETTADDAAREWGCEYLRTAPTLDVDMADQGDRWSAFSTLARIEPTKDAGEDRSAYALAAASLVLVERSGLRFVRTGWFQAYVKREVGGLYSPAALAAQMEAIGWERLNSQGRVKATSPTDDRHLSWRFYIASPDWPGYHELPAQGARAHTRTRERHIQPAVTRAENRIDKPNSRGQVTGCSCADGGIGDGPQCERCFGRRKVTA